VASAASLSTTSPELTVRASRTASSTVASREFDAVFVAAIPDLLRELRRRLPCEVGVADGRYPDRGTELRHVEPRLHRRQTGAQYVRLIFELLKSFTPTVADARRILGVGSFHRRDHRQLHPGRDRPHAVDHHSPQDARSADACFNQIDVRRRVVNDEHVGLLEHFGRDVGVEIERRYERDAATHDATDRL
jgi:hypothetical protein